MLHSLRMQSGEEFRLVPPDSAWPTSLLFETPAQIYQRVYRTLRPRSAVPDVEIRFEKFANANSQIRLRGNVLQVRITDLLEGAPAPVLEALAFILLGKLYRKQIPAIFVHRYRLFLNRRDIRRQAQLVRQQRGRKIYASPRGRVFDLEEIFEELNREHFSGLLARPTLGWSMQLSRTRLGHFDPSHNAIIISRIFDRPTVPRLAVQYVMFHEMLHLLHPVEHAGTRRCVHTEDFKAAERRFPRLAEAKALLKSL